MPRTELPELKQSFSISAPGHYPDTADFIPDATAPIAVLDDPMADEEDEKPEQSEQSLLYIPRTMFLFDGLNPEGAKDDDGSDISSQPVECADGRIYASPLDYDNGKDDKYIDSPESDDGYYIYEPTDRFREAFQATDDPDMDLNGLDFWSENADSLIRMTEKLAAYVEDTSIPENLATTTNSAGEAAFAGLSPGLYLALGDPVVKNLGGPDGSWTFIPQAALIPVPLLQPDDQQWIFIVNIDVKISQDPPPGLDDLIPVSVRKVWEGDLEHPSSVTVELLANGMAFEGANAKVVLSEDNNWSYTWPLLSSRYNWTVREEVPSGWQASYTQNGIDFTITNRPMPPDDPASTPSSAPKPRPTSSGGSVKSRILHGSSISSSLPQTGQLWWPVPLLAAIGALLLLIGAILSIGREESEVPYE